MKELNKKFTSENQVKRICNATKYSISGFKSAFQTEAAFRQNCLIFLINTIFSFMVTNTMLSIWFIFCGFFLLFAELINTAIEYIIDRISSEIHPLSGKAKDIGSALVFLALTNLIVSWSIYLLKN